MNITGSNVYFKFYYTMAGIYLPFANISNYQLIIVAMPIAEYKHFIVNTCWLKESLWSSGKEPVVCGNGNK